MSQRDARIAADVIQWLGSNCGFAFLRTCLEKAGYKIVRIKDEEHYRNMHFDNIEEINRLRDLLAMVGAHANQVEI